MAIVHDQKRGLLFWRLRRDNNVFFAIRTTTASAHESNGAFQARVAGGTTKGNSIGHGPLPYQEYWLGARFGQWGKLG
jgi:hypothetical protein